MNVADENDIDIAFINKYSLNWWCGQNILYVRDPLPKQLYDSINLPTRLEEIKCRDEACQLINYVAKHDDIAECKGCKALLR